MKALDRKYLEQHILDYINFQLEQGYAKKDILSALIRYGYKKKEIQHIFKNATQETMKRIPATKEAIRQLDKDLNFYLKNMLIDYTKKQLEQGYTKRAIRKALINYGHNRKMVDDAITMIEKGEYRDEEKPLVKFPRLFVLALTIVIGFVAVFLLSVVTNENILKALFAFVPFFASLILVYLTLTLIQHGLVRRFIPIFSVVFTVGIFILMLNMSVSLRAMGTDILLALNAVLSFVLSSLLSLFSKGEDKEVIEKM